MSNVPPAQPAWPDVIAGYWRRYAHMTAASPNRADIDEDFWAWEAVDSVWTDGVPQAIEKLIELADAAPDDDGAFGYLGAGPLEDLIEFWSGEFEEEIVAAAQGSSNFRAALRRVYPTPMALVIWERLATA